ncbi:cysteine methyltransferase [Elizabethkingia argentiflava]|uniref:Cysteine methyltransferase n=1 Tax=Elizabethkingia argenteiflava TaxID=2681556 RepID=A0A845PYE0_9FLAO|nr:MGMT family protein [Elizabethkingia argenteiflava]NAW51931.1 cysteine methyltransferase [Elizabethkingia argenteiflava]
MNQQFKDSVFQVVSMIPRGRVTSYGAIARALGCPNYARHVGNILRNCDQDLPVHRVCNASGVITAGGCISLFILKLKQEGLTGKEGKIQNFRAIFWDPLKEI